MPTGGYSGPSRPTMLTSPLAAVMMAAQISALLLAASLQPAAAMPRGAALAAADYSTTSGPEGGAYGDGAAGHDGLSADNDAGRLQQNPNSL